MRSIKSELRRVCVDPILSAPNMVINSQKLFSYPDIQRGVLRVKYSSHLLDLFSPHTGRGAAVGDIRETINS